MMLQLVMLTLVLTLLVLGFGSILGGLFVSNGGTARQEILASIFAIAFGSVLISSAVCIIDSTLHWWL